jgi:hypothetical protein
MSAFDPQPCQSGAIPAILGNSRVYLGNPVYSHFQRVLTIVCPQQTGSVALRKGKGQKMRTWRAFSWSIAVVLLMAPSSVFAQSSTTGAIAGIVKDTTGAVLPGVTVEAASPALIEKVRTVVTDANGNYKIVDLRPGVYSVTFSLTGFSTVKREGVELTTGVTANINSELKVGALEETVTVTGASPVVDVQNVRTQTVISEQVLDALPSNKGVAGFSALTLGATVGAGGQDVGGNKGEGSSTMSIAIHGGRGSDSKMMVDGMLTHNNSVQGGGSSMNYRVNTNAVQETTLETGGMSAEATTGGVQLNYVPKDGGNTFSAYSNLAYSNSHLQGSNLSSELQARGVTTAGSVTRNDDFGIGVGGPLKKDRLWFYTAHRLWGTNEVQPGAFYDKSTNPFAFVPDSSRPAYTDLSNRDHTVRVTWQASTKNKITVTESIQSNVNAYSGVNNVTSPESTFYLTYFPQAMTAGTWSYPASSRLLLEAGAAYMDNPKASPLHDGATPDSIQITDAGTGVRWGAYATTNSTAYSQNGQSGSQMNGRASFSYITGSHAFKSGMTFYRGWDHIDRYVTQELSYTFRNGAPLSITQYAMPNVADHEIFDTGWYTQDQWTIRHLTLNGGLRFDAFRGWVRATDLPAARFLPARHFDAVSDVPNWKDVSPRFGGAYDVFGNGKTAVKASLGRYVLGMGVGLTELNDPQLALVLTATRTWTDSNGNFVPDCVLTNFAANGECGALNNKNFGQVVPSTTYADDVLHGFGVRPYNWQGAVNLQQELRPGVALNVGYFRLWYGNFSVQQNTAVTAASFTAYCLTAPTDARLSASSASQICGLYDINPSSFGTANNVVTQASHFGNQTEVFNGFDVSVNARIGRAFVVGGVSTGRTVTDNCYANSRPDLAPADPSGSFATVGTQPRIAAFCHIAPPLGAGTQVKLNGSYPLPWGLQASGTFQNLGGLPDTATNTFTNAQIAPALGRNLSAGASGTATYAILVPQTIFENRLTQIDVRFSKMVRVRKLRVQGLIDFYNVLNANTVLGVNGTYGSSWLRPTSVLGPRLTKIGAIVEF